MVQEEYAGQESHKFHHIHAAPLMTYIHQEQTRFQVVHVGGDTHPPPPHPHHPPQFQPGFALVVTTKDQVTPLISRMDVVCVVYEEEEVRCIFILSPEKIHQVVLVNEPEFMLYFHH